MTAKISISAEWLSADHGQDEIRKTSALLRIEVGANNVTRVEDDWSQSVHSRVRLSAYPLALWFASSWWRLRWEPAPSGPPSLSWLMAHQLSAAGYGFLWPQLIFDSDGETIEAICLPSASLSTEPVRYLSRFREYVEAIDFEREIDVFVRLVLARLEAIGMPKTELHQLWREVLEERADPDLANFRRLEAQLGFEPDEGPEPLLNDLDTLSKTAGKAAVAELAPACAGENAASTLQEIIEFSRSLGAEGQIAFPKALQQPFKDPAYEMAAPWERGRLLAGETRSVMGIEPGPVSDNLLADLFQFSPSNLAGHDSKQGRVPLGLAIRRQDSEKIKLLFRKRNRPGLRFEAARFLADHLVTPAEEYWLPATDTKTARQKAQRAFAAEFLCPIEALKDFLGRNLSAEAIEEAGEHFGVSALAVRSHLANHDLLPFGSGVV